MDQEALRLREFDELYHVLSDSLSRLGTESDVGEGDFWVLDDDYGSPQHKVYVHRVPFLTRSVAATIQQALHGRKLPWEVIVEFSDRDPRRHPDDWGITIRPNEIEEHWNLSRIRGAYGEAFKWD